MTLNQLEYFTAVSETLNFTKAAQQFYISQTAVSQQIRALEEELGVQLFFRTNRSVALTPAGRTFLEDAQAILRRAKDACARARLAETIFTGDLAIGFVKGFEKNILADLMSEFHERYPNIALRFLRENVSELYDAVLEQRLDLVFNIRYSMDDLDDLETRVIKQYPLLAVMPASHPLAHRSSIRREELRGYPLVDIKKNDSRYGEKATILRAFANAGFLPQAAYVSDDIETSILSVAAGLGYALLPSYITNTLSMREKIIAVPIEGEEKQMTIIAAWRKDNQNPAVQYFLQDCLFPALIRLGL